MRHTINLAQWGKGAFSPLLFWNKDIKVMFLHCKFRFIVDSWFRFLKITKTCFVSWLDDEPPSPTFEPIMKILLVIRPVKLNLYADFNLLWLQMYSYSSNLRIYIPWILVQLVEFGNCCCSRTGAAAPSSIWLCFSLDKDLDSRRSTKCKKIHSRVGRIFYFWTPVCWSSLRSCISIPNQEMSF